VIETFAVAIEDALDATLLMELLDLLVEDELLMLPGEDGSERLEKDMDMLDWLGMLDMLTLLELCDVLDREDCDETDECDDDWALVEDECAEDRKEEEEPPCQKALIAVCTQVLSEPPCPMRKLWTQSWMRLCRRSWDPGICAEASVAKEPTASTAALPTASAMRCLRNEKKEGVGIGNGGRRYGHQGRRCWGWSMTALSGFPDCLRRTPVAKTTIRPEFL
jgi:hypothetical protein